MRLAESVLTITLLAGLAFGRTQSNFDPDRNAWSLSGEPPSSENMVQRPPVVYGVNTP